MKQPLLSAADEGLLLRLGEVGRVADPVPAHVLDFGRAAFALRDLDSQLAELVADSAVELAGVRSGSAETRLLSFEVGDLAIEVQVSTSGGRQSILGQVVSVPPASDAVVHLESHDGATAAATLGPEGNFRFDAVPDGLVRLRVEVPDAPVVTTTWVSL